MARRATQRAHSRTRRSGARSNRVAPAAATASRADSRRASADGGSGSGSSDAMRAKDKAATRIQAGFRGYRVRKQLRMAAQGKRLNGPRRGSVVGADNGTASPVHKKPTRDAAAETTKPASAAVLVIGGKETEATPIGVRAEAETETLAKSATKIQAGVRGFLVRRRRLAQNRAASTIQAGFRAFRARRDARLRAAATAKI